MESPGGRRRARSQTATASGYRRARWPRPPLAPNGRAGASVPAATSSGELYCPAALKLGGHRARRLVEPAFVKTPGLHDNRQVPALILEQAEVIERIAVDQQQIGPGPRLQRADLAV